MLDQALSCIADDINAHLQRLQDDNLERVVLSNLVDQGGSPPMETENKVVLVLTALDEEKNVLNPGDGRSGLSVARMADPIFLNVHVMLAATHKHYPTALEALSAVVGYIKSKPVFDPINTPLMPTGVRQLNFNMERLGYADLSNLWSYLGSSYLPAVNYTIRMVGVGQRQVQSLVPAIDSVGVSS